MNYEATRIAQLESILRSQRRLSLAITSLGAVSATGMVGSCLLAHHAIHGGEHIPWFCWALLIGSFLVWEVSYRRWLEPWRKRLKREGEAGLSLLPEADDEK